MVTNSEIVPAVTHSATSGRLATQKVSNQFIDCLCLPDEDASCLWVICCCFLCLCGCFVSLTLWRVMDAAVLIRSEALRLPLLVAGWHVSSSGAFSQLTCSVSSRLPGRPAACALHANTMYELHVSHDTVSVLFPHSCFLCTCEASMCPSGRAASGEDVFVFIIFYYICVFKQPLVLLNSGCLLVINYY